MRSGDKSPGQTERQADRNKAELMGKSVEVGRRSRGRVGSLKFVWNYSITGSDTFTSLICILMVIMIIRFRWQRYLYGNSISHLSNPPVALLLLQILGISFSARQSGSGFHYICILQMMSDPGCSHRAHFGTTTRSLFTLINSGRGIRDLAHKLNGKQGERKELYF